MMNVERWGYRVVLLLGGAWVSLGCTSDKQGTSGEAVSVSSEGLVPPGAKRKYWSKNPPPSIQQGTGENIGAGGGAGSPSANCTAGNPGVESAPPLPTENGDVLTIPGFARQGVAPTSEMPNCIPGDSGNFDDVHFVYWPVSGDAEITARIADIVGPAGKDKGQVGVMIRARSSDPRATMGAGAFTVGADIPKSSTPACGSDVSEGASCTVPKDECFQPTSNYCRCTTVAPSVNQWKCDLPGNQVFASWRNGVCYGQLPPPAIKQIKGLKIRLQRIGQHYSVSFQKPGETLWRPLYSVGGGEFAPVDADIGLFVSNVGAETCGTQNEVSAKFDQISIKHANTTPPFVPEYRTTWLGTNRDQYCTMTANGCSGEISQDATSFHVFPGNGDEGPLIYKHTPDIEGGHTIQVIDANGKVERGTPRPLGSYVLQGAITQDPLPSPLAQPSPNKYYAYVASGLNWGGVGPYCVDRLDKKTLKVPCMTPKPGDPEVCQVSGEDTCGVDGVDDPERRLTAIGGMAAVQHGTQNRLYVTQPDRDGDGNYTDDPRLVEMRPYQQNGLWRMEVSAEFPTPPYPGPVTGGHGRLWVAHMPTNYIGANALGASSTLTNMNNFDVKFDPTTSRVRSSIRCYRTDTALPCDSNSTNPAFGEIKGCLDANGDGKITGSEANGCVVNPVAVAFRRDTTLALSELYIADNGIDQQFVRIFNNLHTATPTEIAWLGVPGGIYSGTKGLMVDGGTAWTRFYNLLGVGVDNAGGVYVSMNGLPGADIRKFTRSGTAFTYQWNIQGLLGFGRGQEIAAFDPGTDGADAYSFNKHFSFNTSVNNPPDPSPPTAGGAMAPGSEWSLKALSWDPHNGEKDADGRYARDRGHTVIRRVGSDRYMYVLSGDVTPSTYQPTNTALPAHELIAESRPGAPVSIKQAIHVYRFNGEIATPIGSIEVVGIDTEPMPRCDDDCDCTNDGNRKPAYQLSSYSLGAKQWSSPASLDAFLDNTTPYCPMPTLGCPVHPKCIDKDGNEQCDDRIGSVEDACSSPNACRAGVRVGHPKPELCPDLQIAGCHVYPQDTCQPPALSTFGAIPSGRIQGFDVDPSNLDLWLITNQGVGFSTKILKLSATLSAMGPTYVSAPAASGFFSFTPQGAPQGIKVFPNDSPPKFFVLGEGTVYRFTNSLAETPETQTLLGGSPWEATETCGGHKAFDIAGDKIFVSNRCGAIEVYNKDFAGNSTAQPLILLSAGPELAGSQAWQDGEMGISAFRRQNGEYLVSTVESGPLPHNIVFRYNP